MNTRKNPATCDPTHSGPSYRCDTAAPQPISHYNITSPVRAVNLSSKRIGAPPCGVPLIATQYAIGAKIGSGITSEVFRAFKLDSDRSECVALKRIPKKKRGVNSLAQTMREIKALASIASHPNIITLLDFVDGADAWYLVMECGINDLQQVLEMRGEPFPDRSVCHFARQMTSALHHMHTRGIIHRDCKLSNLIVTELRKDGLHRLVIADLGSAACVPHPPTQVTVAPVFMGCGQTSPSAPHHRLFQEVFPCSPRGSVPYVAPEVLARKQYGFAVDLWATGTALFVLLSGHFPLNFAATASASSAVNYWQAAHMHGKTPAAIFSGFGKIFTDDARDFIAALLQPTPDQRMTAEEASHHRWLQ